MAEILATYSPCCGMLRKGQQPPGIMHTGMCRERNGGSLGPTIHLIDAREVEQLRSDLTACQLERDNVRSALREAAQLSPIVIGPIARRALGSSEPKAGDPT